MLTTLHAHGIRRLMVEGGPTILSEFLRRDLERKLIDNLFITVCPVLIGSDIRLKSFMAGIGGGPASDVNAGVDDADNLGHPTWAQCGRDCWLALSRVAPVSATSRSDRPADAR